MKCEICCDHNAAVGAQFHSGKHLHAGAPFPPVRSML
jgi:hypothetical protein